MVNAGLPNLYEGCSSRTRSGRRLTWDHRDFKDCWLLLAGDEEAAVLGVVRYAIEDGLGGEALRVGEESAEVNPGDNMAVGGRNFGDTVGVPDVAVDEAVDVFEFIELVDKVFAIVDEDVAGFGEGLGVAKAEVGGPVRGDELVGGAGDAPAFAGVVELTGLAEGLAVVHEAGVGLPGPLEKGVAVGDDAFAKIWCGKVDMLRGAERVDEEAGVTFEAGAFVEEAVLVEEAFGVAGCRVRVGVEDAIGVNGGLRGCGNGKEREKEG